MIRRATFLSSRNDGTRPYLVFLRGFNGRSIQFAPDAFSLCLWQAVASVVINPLTSSTIVSPHLTIIPAID